MTRTIEVDIDANGRIRPVEPTSKMPQGRALVTWQTPEPEETASLSETALAEDWLRPGEDEAWEHLQPGK